MCISVIMRLQKTLAPCDPGNGMYIPTAGYGIDPITGGNGIWLGAVWWMYPCAGDDAEFRCEALRCFVSNSAILSAFTRRRCISLLLAVNCSRKLSIFKFPSRKLSAMAWNKGQKIEYKPYKTMVSIHGWLVSIPVLYLEVSGANIGLKIAILTFSLVFLAPPCKCWDSTS